MPLPLWPGRLTHYELLASVPIRGVGCPFENVLLPASATDVRIAVWVPGYEVADARIDDLWLDRAETAVILMEAEEKRGWSPCSRRERGGQMRRRSRIDLACVLLLLVPISVPGIVSAEREDGVPQKRVTVWEMHAAAESELRRLGVVRSATDPWERIDYAALSAILDEQASRLPDRSPTPEARTDANTRAAGYVLAAYSALQPGYREDAARPREAERIGRADAVRAVWRLAEAVYSDSAGSPAVRWDCVFGATMFRAGSTIWKQGLSYLVGELPSRPAWMSRHEAVRIASEEPLSSRARAAGATSRAGDGDTSQVGQELAVRTGLVAVEGLQGDAGERGDLKFRLLLLHHPFLNVFDGKWTTLQTLHPSSGRTPNDRYERLVLSPARACIGASLRVPVDAKATWLTGPRDLTRQLAPCIRTLLSTCRSRQSDDRTLEDWFDGWPCIRIDRVTLTSRDSVIVRLRGEELGIDERWAFKAVRGARCPEENR